MGHHDIYYTTNSSIAEIYWGSTHRNRQVKNVEGFLVEMFIPHI